MTYAIVHKPLKNHVVAVLLSFFLGGLGVDRFYLGHVGLGIAKLLCGWLTLGIWPLIDFILVCLRKVDDSNFIWSDRVPVIVPAPQYGVPMG
ncbi:MAG: TM2 domain-containing protein [Leucobacter sp.]